MKGSDYLTVAQVRQIRYMGMKGARKHIENSQSVLQEVERVIEENRSLDLIRMKRKVCLFWRLKGIRNHFFGLDFVSSLNLFCWGEF
jgi:glutamate/tyrosine decarboxylase-like PLP-dependent enzyme